MVQAADGAFGTAPSERRVEPKMAGGNYVRLAGIAAVTLAICALTLLALPSQEEPIALVHGDAESEANKVFDSQHFKKATRKERETTVTHLLGKEANDDNSKVLINKIAQVVANKHESYHERMEAMKKLLDSQTDSLKTKGLPHAKAEPKHAASKEKSRGRKDTQADNMKAIRDGEKLMAHTHTSHTKRLHLDAHDQAIKDASEHEKADPKIMEKWMKKQAEESKTAAQKKHAAKKAAEAKIAAKKAANSDTPPPASSSWSKLVAWAEAHGLPHKLADNPADKTKVKDIIARMKADEEVERIKQQFAHDDSLVKDVVHGADPGSAGVI